MMGSVPPPGRCVPGVDGPADMGPLFIILSLSASTLGGALWGGVAGFLKTKGGVNEIFAGLGLNFSWRRASCCGLSSVPQPRVASMSGTSH